MTMQVSANTVVKSPAEHELNRLASLYQYQILDTEPEDVFDQLVRLAAQIYQTPIALISFIDAERQWFKSKVGLQATEIPREIAFCVHTILQSEPFIVPDALQDQRYAANPLVIADPHIRFYAGVPLINEDGFALGALCVIDRVPRQQSVSQMEALQTLAHQVVRELDLRRRLRGVTQQQNQFQRELRDMQAMFDNAFEGLARLDQRGRFLAVNPVYARLLGYQPEELMGLHWQRLIHPDDQPAVRAAYQYMMATGEAAIEVKAICKDGTFACQQLMLVAAHTQQQEWSGHFCFINDVTERRQIEEALRRQSKRERLVAEIAQRIRQSLDLDEILKTTVAEVRRFLQTDRVIVYRFKPDWSGVVAVESVAPEWTPILYSTLDSSCFPSDYAPQYQQGRVRAIEDIYAAGLAQCHVELLETFQVRANLVVPILQGQQLWGLLIAHHCSGPRHWQQLEIELLSHLATQAGIAIQQSDLYQQLQQQAIIDGLTQVANRRRFDEYWTQQWQQMTRTKQPLSLILCDIDFFKRYNDTYGHLEGDRCLQQVAKALCRAVTHPGDLVARYGGEEFAVILPDTPAEGGFEVAKRMQAAIQALQISHQHSQAGQYVSLSIGVSSAIPESCMDAAILIKTADQALYQAKQQERNQVVLKFPSA